MSGGGGECEWSAGVLVVLDGRVLMRRYWHRGGEERWGLPKGKIKETDGVSEEGPVGPSDEWVPARMRARAADAQFLKCAVVAAIRECQEECGVVILDECGGWPTFVRNGGEYTYWSHSKWSWVTKNIVWFKYDGRRQWPGGAVFATVAVKAEERTAEVRMLGRGDLVGLPMAESERRIVNDWAGVRCVGWQPVRRPWNQEHAAVWVRGPRPAQPPRGMSARWSVSEVKVFMEWGSRYTAGYAEAFAVQGVDGSELQAIHDAGWEWDVGRLGWVLKGRGYAALGRRGVLIAHFGHVSSVIWAFFGQRA